MTSKKILNTEHTSLKQSEVQSATKRLNIARKPITQARARYTTAKSRHILTSTTCARIQRYATSTHTQRQWIERIECLIIPQVLTAILPNKRIIKSALPTSILALKDRVCTTLVLGARYTAGIRVCACAYVSGDRHVLNVVDWGAVDIVCDVVIRALGVVGCFGCDGGGGDRACGGEDCCCCLREGECYGCASARCDCHVGRGGRQYSRGDGFGGQDGATLVSNTIM